MNILVVALLHSVGAVGSHVSWAGASTQALCAPLKQVIASGDAFHAIQQQELKNRGARRYWASSVELPGSSTAAVITQDRGETVFEAEFGTWENLSIGGLSFPDEKELDERFNVVRGDLIACLPGWVRAKDAEWELILTGPTHALELAVMDNDEDHWVRLRVCRSSAAARLFDLPQPSPAVKNGTRFSHALVSLTLPPGWSVRPKSPNPAPNLIATFESPALGARAYVNGAERLGSLYDVVRLGHGMVLQTLPGAIPSERRDTMQTAGGDTLVQQTFVGKSSYAVATGQLVGVIFAATVNSHRGLVIRIYYPLVNAAQAEAQFGEMIRSIR